MSEEIDLSQFDDIPDRIERAKAKAAAIRAAKEGGGTAPTAPTHHTPPRACTFYTSYLTSYLLSSFPYT